MAKLNKGEIRAIAERIYNSNKEEVKNYNEALKKGLSFEDWKKTFILSKEYKKIEECYSKVKEINFFMNKYCKSTYRENRFFDSYENLENLFTIIYTQQLKHKSVDFNVGDIERDLIIEQAINPDIESMIKKIENKYKNA